VSADRWLNLVVGFLAIENCKQTSSLPLFGAKYKLWGRNCMVFRHVRKISKGNYLVSSCLSVLLSVCPSASKNSAPTGRIFMKFDIWVFFFENLSRTFDFR
jgi:hypothetical protein